MAEESLEPGDLLLLYTDGLTEARHPDGQIFTVAGPAEFIEREAAAGRTAPETLRRLGHAIVDRQPGQLKDDATQGRRDRSTGRVASRGRDRAAPADGGLTTGHAFWLEHRELGWHASASTRRHSHGC